MKKLIGLNKEEVTAISRQIADAFYDYKYNAEDLGLVKYICKLTAKWVVIEGTEGCKGYKDYMYHFKGFLIGCVYSAIMAIIISGIDYLILRFIVW